MRKLASIQKITEILPIDGADNIVKVKVLGWDLVAKKGEFAEGDPCVYFEIDSQLPEHPVFEFVKRGSTKSSALRLRTIKLRGVVSQGLAMPLSVLQHFRDGAVRLLELNDEQASNFDYHSWIDHLELGQDVTDIFGITKWEPKESSGKQGQVSKGNFPFYVPKTDETRIQSCPDVLDEMRGVKVYSTVKMDGCSATYIHLNGEYNVCSRNLALKSLEEKLALYEERKSKGKEVWEPKVDRWWEMSDRLGLKEKLEARGNFAIQGELCGPGIQKNRLGLKENKLYVFNVYDIDNTKYLNLPEFIEFCHELGLDTVPIEEEFVIDETITVPKLLEMAEGKYDSGHEREGIVVRPVKERYSHILKGRMSFKAISNKFLLKIGG
jgi:RNA ligase (TIGR02306 family)